MVQPAHNSTGCKVSSPNDSDLSLFQEAPLASASSDSYSGMRVFCTAEVCERDAQLSLLSLEGWDLVNLVAFRDFSELF